MSFYVCRAALCQRLKSYDGIEDSKANTLSKLVELHHVMCQEDQHGIVTGISLPPAAPCSGPTHRTDAATTYDRIRLLGIEHNGDP